MTYFGVQNLLFLNFLNCILEIQLKFVNIFTFGFGNFNPDISITCTSKNLSDKIKKEKKNGIQFAATPNEFRVVAVISHLF